MEHTGKYALVSRVGELEVEIEAMIEATKKDQEMIKTVVEKSDILIELDYDLDCDMRLFKHLLKTITFYKAIMCLTDEKHHLMGKEES